MLPNIISHNSALDTTTTLRLTKEGVSQTEDVIIELVDGNDTALTDTNIHSELAKISTPFLLGLPSVVSPKKNDLLGPDSTFKITLFKPSPSFTGTNYYPRWQISKNGEFKTNSDTDIIIDVKLPIDTPDKTIWTPDLSVLSSVSTYYVRARYEAPPNASPWSDKVRFNIYSSRVLKPILDKSSGRTDVTITSSAFGLTDTGLSDMLRSVTWKVFRLPDQFKDNDYYEANIYNYVKTATPSYTKIKLASGNRPYEIDFPVRSEDTLNIEYELSPGLYTITCSHTGSLFNSDIGYIRHNIVDAKLTAPIFKVRSNFLTPAIEIEPFNGTVEGDLDTLNRYIITIYKLKPNDISLVYKADITTNTYIVPSNVLEPDNDYKILLVAVGNKYGVSDTSELNINIPDMGIYPPIVRITNIGMEPRITLSPFIPKNSDDTMVGTEWELYNHALPIDINQQPIDTLLKTYTKNNLDTFLVIPKTDLEPNTNYKVRVRYVGRMYKSNWVEVVFKTIDLIIDTPTINVSNIGLNIIANISEYVIVGDVDEPKQVLWTVRVLDNLGQPVGTLIEDLPLPYNKSTLSIDKTNGVLSNTKYSVKGKIVGTNYSSPWSSEFTITTPNISIIQPTITITGIPNDVPEYPVIQCSPFRLTDEEDKHVATTYKIVKTLNNEEVLNIKDEHNLTNYFLHQKVLEESTDYTLTVIYHSENYGDSSPVTINFRTRNSFIFVPEDKDSMTNILLGDDTTSSTPKYYGTIKPEDLDNTREYYGRWDGLRDYLPGEQVYHEDKLWYSLDTTDAEGAGQPHTNKNREPGVVAINNVTYWAEDTRTALPTYRWLLKHISFNDEVVDNNVDGMTTGSNKRGSYALLLDGSVNKYVLNGKVVYMYNKAELSNISYNDIVKVGIHKPNNRTIRIGERLYYVRIPTIEDIRAIKELRTLDPGKLTMADEIEGEYWVYDSSNTSSSEATVIDGLNIDIKSSISGKSRSVGLRLILEYIPEDREPWKFLKIKYPTLQYDRYTDTGYFGKLYVEDYNIYTTLGFLKGVKINREAGFLAFYSHGKRLLVTRMPIAYGVSYNELLESNLVYGGDYKLEGHTNTIVGGYGPDDRSNYVVRLLRGGINYIAPGPLADLADTTFAASKNICKYSEWNELLYRVTKVDPKDVDRTPMHGGFEIGDNWDLMDNINVGVFEHYSGNGCHDFVLCDVNNNEILSRGGKRLDMLYYVPKHVKRNDHGVRLVFEDITND